MTTRTTVRFNRKEQVWQAINGKAESFPANQTGKRQALLSALAQDHPHLFEVVNSIAENHNNNPQLVERMLKACQLVVRGNVYSNGRVKSQSSEETYQTSFDGFPKSWYCQCADFDNGQQRHAGLSKFGGVDSHYGLVCKHILAQLIADFADLELPDEEIPF